MKGGFSLILVLISVVVIATLGSAILSAVVSSIKNEKYALSLRMAVDEWTILRLHKPSKGKMIGYMGSPPIRLKKYRFVVNGFVFEEVDY
ncbi:MAG: hypothetical protein J7L41_08770 [Synergistetes bacterium]|nr:hypothetical protein [Synergistota bacterium]